jgi:hypothetical protein
MRKTPRWVVGGAILVAILATSFWLLRPRTVHLVILHAGRSKGQVLPHGTDGGPLIKDVAFLVGAAEAARRETDVTSAQHRTDLLLATGDIFFGSLEALAKGSTTLLVVLSHLEPNARILRQVVGDFRTHSLVRAYVEGCIIDAVTSEAMP